jgi:hypothetical protein
MTSENKDKAAEAGEDDVVEVTGEKTDKEKTGLASKYCAFWILHETVAWTVAMTLCWLWRVICCRLRGSQATSCTASLTPSFVRADHFASTPASEAHKYAPKKVEAAQPSPVSSVAMRPPRGLTRIPTACACGVEPVGLERSWHMGALFV